MDPPSSGYTLMVAGRRTGKTSFLRLLLDTSVISLTATRDQLASVAKFVQGCGGFTSHIRTTSVDIHSARSDRDEPSPLLLTLIDTPALDFDNEEASSALVSDILKHVEGRFSESVEDERKAATGDHHVHLCIYFLDPDEIVPPSVSSPAVPLAVPRARTNSVSKPGDIDSTVILEPPVPTNPAICRPTLPSVDITTIRKLSTRVNVLPVVACADTLTNDRLAIIKSVIKYDLAKAGIGFGIFDTNADPPLAPELFLDAPGSPPPLLPFALISPDIYSHSDGVNKASQPQSRHELLQQYTPSIVLNNARNSCSPPHPASKLVPRKYLRSYRWGSLDVMDRNHCDFVALREAIFFHMETLKKYTKEYLYQRFTTEYIQAQQTAISAARGPITTNGTRPPAFASKPILAIDTNAPNQLVNNRHPSLAVPHSALNGDSVPHPAISAQAVPDLSPNTANSSRSGRQRSKKITVACNFCRSRKLKCDGGRPACGQCGKRGHSCDYTVNRKSRANNRRRKFEDNISESEGEADGESGEPSSVTGGMEPSLSPEVSVSSKSQSRRNSNVELPLNHTNHGGNHASTNGDIKLPPLLTANDRREDSSYTLPPITTTGPPTTSGSLIPPPPPSNSSHSSHSHPSHSHSSHPHSSQSLAPTTSASTEGRREYLQTELPPIATLSVPEDGTGHALPPLRGQAAAESGSTGGRRRTSSASTKGSRGSYGSKIVACNFCRMRKTKCDGGHPACSSCSKRNQVCSYVNDPTAANPKGRPKTAPAPGGGPSGSTSDRSSPVANGATVSAGPAGASVASSTVGSGAGAGVSGSKVVPSMPLGNSSQATNTMNSQQHHQLHQHQQQQQQQQSPSAHSHHSHSVHHPQSHPSHSHPSSLVHGHTQSHSHNLSHIVHSTHSSSGTSHMIPPQSQHQNQNQHQQQQQHQQSPLSHRQTQAQVQHQQPQSPLSPIGHENGIVIAPSNVPPPSRHSPTSYSTSSPNELKRNLELDVSLPSTKKMRMAAEGGISTVAVTVARIQ
ncbi:hypothetical protein QCA50_015263 [Cerrena zonata]|uniref:Zn(2)-C6 fungal-type domain-containing protein n=1 Tax=Cerrena zonata TaxID=2478898 RepID=A0AAW0FLM7_9APHY